VIQDDLNRLRLRRLTRVALLALSTLLAPACALAADPAKVLRVAFEAADDGFDMAHTTNGFSGRVAEAIFETLLTYDYLARPATLVPLTAEAMPDVSSDGRTYTFRLRRGIYFAPDPAFHGGRRELTADDYAYAIKRLIDPAVRAQTAHFVQDRIAGLDVLAERAKKTGRFDYAAAVEGLEMPDRYTLRVRLTRPDFNFLYIMAYPALAAVAPEIIAAYGQDSGRHPVGTGPYMLTEYVPRSRIVLQANPNYRGFVWQFKATDDAWDRQLIRDMQGKTMPRIGRVEISIIEEQQARWLTFLDGRLDFDKLPQLAAPIAMEGRRLKPEFARQGISVYTTTIPDINYTYFNFRDPTVGGYKPENIALRRAIAMAYNSVEEIKLIQQDQAVSAEMVVPEGVIGHDPDYRSSIRYDPDLANRLLDRFRYRRAADGYRSMPDGAPLLLRMRLQPDSRSRQNGELWKRCLDRIGLRLEISVSEFAESGKAASACELPMWQLEWFADYPEAENFLQLFYGPNSGQGNYACYRSPLFDELYRRMLATAPGAERNRLVAEMNRQIEADTVWVLRFSQVENWILRPWVKGFKRHPILQSDWKYLDVDSH
jgi:ABC-type transport system substrate-binding protein